MDPRVESVKFKTKHELSHKPVTCLLSLWGFPVSRGPFSLVVGRREEKRPLPWAETDFDEAAVHAHGRCFAKHMLLVMFTNSFLSLIKKKLSRCMCSCSTTFTRLIFVWSKFYDYSRGLFSLAFVLYSFLFTRYGQLHMNLSLLFTVPLKRTVNSELRILQNCSKYHFWGKGSVGKVTQCSFSIEPCT